MQCHFIGCLICPMCRWITYKNLKNKLIQKVSGFICFTLMYPIKSRVKLKMVHNNQ